MTYNIQAKAMLIAIALNLTEEGRQLIEAALTNAHLAGQLEAVEESNQRVAEILQ